MPFATDRGFYHSWEQTIHHTAASICFSEALLSIFIWWHKAILPTTFLQEHNINQEDKDLNKAILWPRNVLKKKKKKIEKGTDQE